MTKQVTTRKAGEVTFDGLTADAKSKVVSAIQKGATRRDVMKTLGAMGITAAAAGTIFGSATKAIAATPTKGGNLKFAWDLHGPSDTLDPALFTSSIDYVRGRSTFNNLVRIHDDMSVNPELAEEFSSNSDATEWTFKLRNGVKFHDGSPLTADDVIYSMNRHIGEDSTSKAKPMVEMVDEWVKVDNNTIKAKLGSPNSDLGIALGTFHFKIVKDGDTEFKNGTGPYKLDEFSPGVRSMHSANQDYWNTGAVNGEYVSGPHVDTMEIFGITDAEARLNALLAGDVDMMGNLSPKSLDEVNNNPNVEPWSVNSGAYMDIVCMKNQEPGNNPHFVQAMKHLQRRDRMVKIQLKGQGTTGNDDPINQAYGDYCPTTNQNEYDPEKAKSLLAKSGLSGAELQVAEVGPGLTDICLMLQRECQKIGFDLQIKKVPNDGYWGAVWMKTPMHVSSWNMRPSANIMMSLAYKSDAAWNESQWKNEEFDKLLVEARGVTDPSLRAEMYCRMQDLISLNCGTIVPVHRNYIDGISSKVKGLTRVPIATMGGLEWLEYVYKEA